MPYETRYISTARPGSNRPHSAVAEEITAEFERIAVEGGKFVTAITIADRGSPHGEATYPNGAIYIVSKTSGNK